MAKAIGPAHQGPNPSWVDLTRLLSRLERILLSPESPVEPSRSPYERTKIGANLEYARSLLLRLEHESSSVRIQSKKHSAQVDLSQKRELIKKLNERLYELGQLDDEPWQDDEIEDQDGEAGEPPGLPIETHEEANPDQRKSSFSTHPADSAAERETAQPAALLRSRRRQSVHNDSGFATGTSVSQTAKTETLLSHNRTEQESLTTSLLSMAEALKASSLRFGDSLEAEKEILDRAGEGLEKNTSSMEAAERRMGTLRRMTEGKGWWGRMLMYAWIAGLMIVAFAIVFLMPKLRF